MSVGLVLLVAVAAAVAVYFVRQPDREKRARFLKRAGFTVMAFSTFVFGVFVAGETFADPGGWAALGLVAAWAVPLAGLAALAWYRPGWAVPVFTTLAVAAIGVSAWFAVSPQGWRSFEDQHGPIRDLVTFVLVAAIAVLGLRRPAAAGVLLLIAGIVPPAVSSVGSLLGFTSLAVVSSAPVITGILYLLSAHLAGKPAPPAHSGAGPGELPKAA